MRQDGVFHRARKLSKVAVSAAAVATLITSTSMIEPAFASPGALPAGQTSTLQSGAFAPSESGVGDAIVPVFGLGKATFTLEPQQGTYPDLAPNLSGLQVAFTADDGTNTACILQSASAGPASCGVLGLPVDTDVHVSLASPPPAGFLPPAPLTFSIPSCDTSGTTFCPPATLTDELPGTWRPVGLHVVGAGTGAPVSGATYVLCAPAAAGGSAGGGCPSGLNQAATSTTDQSGNLTFSGVYQGGSYAVVATQVPSGYQAAGQAVPVTVPAVTDASQAGQEYDETVKLSQGLLAPDAPAGSTDAHSGVSDYAQGTASANSGSTSVAAHGVGGITVAQYPHNPTSLNPPLAGPPTYFDVRTSQGNSFGSVTIEQCRLSDGAHDIVWFDGHAWHKATPADYSHGCSTLTLSTATSPSISDLTGTVFAAGALPVSRLGGSDRIHTAAAVSQERFPRPLTADAVVLARADSYPDALAGDPLAAAKDAPLLLSDTHRLSQRTLTEMKRVLPPGSTVYLLGGESALSPAVAHAVTAAGFKVHRVAGQDRYGTALAIARLLGNPRTVFEVPGTGFADALSAAPAAAENGGAILLTNGAEQSKATAGYLARHPRIKRYAIGGLAAAADPGALAVSGSNRYATSAKVATEFFSTPITVDLATGEDFPDALAGGAIGDVPMLLVPGNKTQLSGSTATYLQQAATTALYLRALGGTSALSDGILTAAQRQLQ